MNKTGDREMPRILWLDLHYKVGNHSGIRLARVRDAERNLLDVLAEQEPDPEGWLPLDARLLNHELLRREVDSSPELGGRLLSSIGADGRGFAAQTGSLELRPVGRDRYRVRVLRPWPGIRELAERRNRVSRLIIDLLLSKIPEGTPPRKDLLVEFSFEEIERAVADDPDLRADIKDMLVAIERGLLFLHEQQVIVLQQDACGRCRHHPPLCNPLLQVQALASFGVFLVA